MLLKIIAVGELKGWAKLAFEDYQKRIVTPYHLEHIQINTPRRAKNHDPLKLKDLEAKKILKYIKPDDLVVALDQHGKLLTTEKFSQQLQTLGQSKTVCLVLGGPDGLSQSILTRAQLLLSLSPMVLPHALARVMLIEQIYRSYTLISNHPYHRE